VRLLLRKPLSTGQTDLLFEPLALLRRLAASIPKPRQNMVRFHGIFAPHAAKRSLLAQLVPTPAACATTPLRRADPVAATTSNATLDPSPLPAAPTPVPVPYRRPWAELLRRIHDHDVLRCPRCERIGGTSPSNGKSAVYRGCRRGHRGRHEGRWKPSMQGRRDG